MTLGAPAVLAQSAVAVHLHSTARFCATAGKVDVGANAPATYPEWLSVQACDDLARLRYLCDEGKFDEANAIVVEKLGRISEATEETARTPEMGATLMLCSKFFEYTGNADLAEETMVDAHRIMAKLPQVGESAEATVSFYHAQAACTVAQANVRKQKFQEAFDALYPVAVPTACAAKFHDAPSQLAALRVTVALHGQLYAIAQTASEALARSESALEHLKELQRTSKGPFDGDLTTLDNVDPEGLQMGIDAITQSVEKVREHAAAEEKNGGADAEAAPPCGVLLEDTRKRLAQHKEGGPEWFGALRAIGVLTEHAEQWAALDEALDQLTAALKQMPDAPSWDADVTINSSRAWARAQQGKIDEAQAILDEAVAAADKEEPGKVPSEIVQVLHCRRAVFALFRGAEGSQKTVDDVIATHRVPREGLLATYVSLLSSNGRHDDAINVLNELKKTAGTQPIWFALAARTYYVAGNMDEAVAACATLPPPETQKFFPDFPFAEAAVIQMVAGRRLGGKSWFQPEAEAMFAKGIDHLKQWGRAVEADQYMRDWDRASQ